MPRDAAGMPAAGGVAAAPVLAGGAAMSQQATRHARRIYVGGLPPSADENNIAVSSWGAAVCSFAEGQPAAIRICTVGQATAGVTVSQMTPDAAKQQPELPCDG